MASARRRSPPSPVMVKCNPPKLRDLDARARLSMKDPDAPQVTAEEWYCTNRAAHHGKGNVLNTPTDNFLLRLPPLHCMECGKVNPTGYSWAMSGTKVNNVSLDSLVRNQGPHGTCVAHAFLTAMDFMRRIHEALEFAGEPGQQLSDQDLFRKYKRIFLTAFGYEAAPSEHLQYERKECIVHIAQKEGVGYDTSPLEGSTRRDFRQRVDPPVTLKMGKVFRIKDGTDNKRTELIVRLLAGGFALIGDIPAGRTLDLVNGHEIYDAHDSVGSNHCVVLMGSGVEDYPSIPTARNKTSRESWPGGRGARIYLRARGSWDDNAHPQSSLDGRGGDFNIWADQVSDVWGFYLADDNP